METKSDISFSLRGTLQKAMPSQFLSKFRGDIAKGFFEKHLGRKGVTKTAFRTDKAWQENWPEDPYEALKAYTDFFSGDQPENDDEFDHFDIVWDLCETAIPRINKELATAEEAGLPLTEFNMKLKADQDDVELIISMKFDSRKGLKKPKKGK